MLRSWPDPRSGVDIYRGEMGINVSDDNSHLAQNFARYGWTHFRQLDEFEYDQGTLRRRKPFAAYSSVNFNASADFGSGAETPGLFKGGWAYIDASGNTRLLHAHTNGTIKEWTATATSVNRVTGLTTGQKVRFEDFNGAVFSVNGADAPRRGDATTWRVAGAPAAIAAPVAGATSAGSLSAGTYTWMVTACIRSGTTVILESDHSAYLSVTLTGSLQQALTWSASGDARVNWYRLYRTQVGLGLPLFLVTEGNITSYTDNVADTALSETVAADLARNGTLSSNYAMVAKCGQRLAYAGTDGVGISIIATNNYEMEYVPNDTIHRFVLPSGRPTACFPIGNKDEQDNANDLFLATKTACYLLRDTDPYGILETISGEVGCRNPDAVAQWGRYLFFMSNRGLEFLGPSGSPIMISRFVNPYFNGGGPLSLSAINGDQFVTLTTWNNKLLITFRSSSSRNDGHQTLVLDLEVFDPESPRNAVTTRFTRWTGPGMAFYVEGPSGELFLFDNDNYRILYRSTGAYDSIAGTNTTIPATWSTGPICGELLTFRKRFCSVNVFHISTASTVATFSCDYGLRAQVGATLELNETTNDWDIEWDMAWSSSPKWQSCVGLRRGQPGVSSMVGQHLTVTVVANNSGDDYVLIGVNTNYTQVKQRTVCAR